MVLVLGAGVANGEFDFEPVFFPPDAFALGFGLGTDTEREEPEAEGVRWAGAETDVDMLLLVLVLVCGWECEASGAVDEGVPALEDLADLG